MNVKITFFTYQKNTFFPIGKIRYFFKNHLEKKFLKNMYFYIGILYIIKFIYKFLSLENSLKKLSLIK